jgi:flagellar biosynthetic protein FlhB
LAEESFRDKTEKATPKKRRDVRKKGEVAKSRELPSVAVLLSAIITLTLFGSYIYSHIQVVIKGALTHSAMNDLCIPEYFIMYAQEMITRYIIIIGPLIAAVFLTAVFSNILQVGFMVSGELIKPKLSKLNPIKGLGKLFSKPSFMELFKTLLKLAIIGGVAYITIKGEILNIPFLGEMDLKAICMYILTVIFKIFIRCTLAMIVLVAIDYAFQKWEFEKRIKMTKQEVKDEFKKTEGDPLIKSRIKSIQMEMARKRMMQAVPHADVVITNPTHLAVAIKYDSSVMNAPKLLAKGAEGIAKRIKDLAEKHEIPIIENKELAKSLYMMVEIGQEVPPLLYQAVAEVLAYIYKLRGNTANGLR